MSDAQKESPEPSATPLEPDRATFLFVQMKEMRWKKIKKGDNLC